MWSGYCQDNAPIPVSIPLGVIGHFPTVFARRFPQLEVEMGAGRVQVLVDGLYQVFPDLDLLFTLHLPAPGTPCIRNVATAPPTMGPEVIRYAGLHAAAPNGAASCAKSWSTPRHVGPCRN